MCLWSPSERPHQCRTGRNERSDRQDGCGIENEHSYLESWERHYVPSLFYVGKWILWRKGRKPAGDEFPRAPFRNWLRGPLQLGNLLKLAQKFSMMFCEVADHPRIFEQVCEIG